MQRKAGMDMEGCNINKKFLEEASQNMNKIVRKCEIRYPSNERILFAIHRGDLETVKKLYDKQPNKIKDCLLTWAIDAWELEEFLPFKQQKLEVVEYLRSKEENASHMRKIAE